VTSLQNLPTQTESTDQDVENQGYTFAWHL
jgi:hypothetical protein